jgi:hypothetical protein
MVTCFARFSTKSYSCSGLRRDKCYGMFFYFQARRAAGEGKRHCWRYINAKTHEILENRYETAQLRNFLPA